jgi:hypothetical protein
VKIFLFALAFYSHSAVALPVVCESLEKTNEVSTLRVKINPKVRILQNRNVWDLYQMGITPQGPGEMRQVMYGTESVRPESIQLSIVKAGSVHGYVDVSSASMNGIYQGKIRISGIVRGRIMDVECFDEAIQGEMRR